MVRQALETLPLAWREVIILRELEARARARLQQLLGSDATREVAR